MPRKTFLQHLRADHQSSRDTVNTLRSLDSLQLGPLTLGQRLRHFLWRELVYVGMALTKILLILIFNFSAVFTFFWLLSLI